MTTSAPIAVTALGMVSSLGTSVVGSCAAARARLSMPAPVKNLDIAGEGVFGRETDDGPPAIFGHHVRGIADEFSGFARLALLAEAALGEALGTRGFTPKEASRSSLIVCAPARFAVDDTRLRVDVHASAERAGRLVDRLAASDTWAAAPARRSVRVGGGGAFALALADAAAELADGRADYVIVGAVDSRIDPQPVRALASLGQLRTNENPAGAMPGEAAAFAIVERRSIAAALSIIGSIATGRDETGLLDSERMPNGIPLAMAIRAASRAHRIDWSIADLTGTSRRAVEWGNTLARIRDLLGDLKTWMPAVSFGDVGTAAGAVGLCVATRAFQRGYAPAGQALISLSSEDGEKGAFTVQAATN